MLVVLATSNRKILPFRVGLVHTNGKVNKKIYDGDIIPDGFYLGMAPNEKFNGRKWYTNGKVNRWVKECPDDDFYIRKI